MHHRDPTGIFSFAEWAGDITLDQIDIRLLEREASKHDHEPGEKLIAHYLAHATPDLNVIDLRAYLTAEAQQVVPTMPKTYARKREKPSEVVAKSCYFSGG